MDQIIYLGDKKYRLSTKYRHTSMDLIFLIHGLGCIKESFDDIWNYDYFSKYSILVPDLMGFGSSSKPLDFSYTLINQANVLKKLLDKYEIEQIHIVAHSMGGAIGIMLTDFIINKLRTFINVEGNLIMEDCGLISKKTTSVSFEIFESKTFQELRDTFIRSPNVGSRLWATWSQKASPIAFYKSAQSLVNGRESGTLLKKFLAMKTNKYYFYGSENKKMAILDKIPKVSTVEIRNSGHFVMNDNPEEFYRKLSEVIE
ncbi:hypothetical protein A3C23_00215 [Candidatus Roizmanbacteria bacterium RIFCSPHIGHO2_02_FULL_37_13b]|uniref:AB hydrolase-1 domain-containing protein n=1 Tax=Candidatus Roizmanbacteria bacterium RIFCSPLOWO2_02_FULL_36_11 TaxID=1802071 RepID=A0A1F7JHM1_9BACT|nr:MAG: hypothetical protein A3C23_00215 [Candidatus Roizmanbacteria bacterium RIFCSPHIGHO2_02_FULL_37_13b]OGK55123.1 MAG: hypothetical protein A3H78_04025 [Candidatus Roizmanbacteria bacterium RIFCSPLOWO2_02_FULL_36_11]